MIPEEIKKISLFHERVEQLRANDDFFKNLSFKLRYEEDKGSRLSFEGPDSKSIKAFLVDFRPFILSGEPVNFYHITSILEKSSLTTELKDKVREAHKVWSELLERKETGPVGGLRLKIDSKNLLSEENMNSWINGDYFHLDEDKRTFLERIKQTPFGGLSHFAFLDLLQRLSGILFWLDKQVILEIKKEIGF